MRSATAILGGVDGSRTKTGSKFLAAVEKINNIVIEVPTTVNASAAALDAAADARLPQIVRVIQYELARAAEARSSPDLVSQIAEEIEHVEANYSEDAALHSSLGWRSTAMQLTLQTFIVLQCFLQASGVSPCGHTRHTCRRR